ncbi:MAG: alpha/beta hydrolase [Shimia sp.]
MSAHDHTPPPLRAAGARLRTGGRALILVHGRGGDAAGMLSLGESLALPDLALLAPEAPGRSWWPTSFLAPQAQMEPFVRAGIAAIDAAVARARAAGARPSLLGFSQGACLALEYAARLGGLEAVFGLSGALVGTADDPSAPEVYGFGGKRFDYDTPLDAIHVIVGCHEADPHIPLVRAEHSAALFADKGTDARFIRKPGAGHGIVDAEIAAIRAVFNG